MKGLISLKASNEKYITASPETRGKLLANHPEHAPLLMVELQNGTVMLRVLTNEGRYVHAIGGGGGAVLADVKEPDANCVFTLVPIEGNKVAFRTANGLNFLSCEASEEVSARGRASGVQETFVMERFYAEEDAETPSDPDAEPLWDEHTHAKIVEISAKLMFRDHMVRPVVRALYALWTKEPFKEALLQGLIDADDFWKPWYTGLLWKFHFYHPGTGRNYMGFGETALSMGNRYCEKAIDLGGELYRKMKHGILPSETELKDCGYALGIASHYITDLTQPMHASNFGNIFGDQFPKMNFKDKRHSGLEDATEKLVVDGKYLDDAAGFTYDKFSPENYSSPGSILHEAARIANGTFENLVRGKMPEPGKDWEVKKVKEVVDASIKSIGLHSVSRFLSFFAQEASKVELVKPGTLYRLKGWQGKYVTKENDRVTMQDRRNSTYQEFFFVSNGDGTHRIVCNGDRGRRWTLQNTGWNVWVMHLRAPHESPDKASRFRLAAHGGHRIKIHEFTEKEVVAVRTAWSYVGHLHRWGDMEADTHYFTLEEVGPLNLESSKEEPEVFPQPGAPSEGGESKTVNFNFTINL